MPTHFQKAIENVLKKHNLLDAFQANSEFSFRLDMPGYDRLVIERQGKTVIVGHYFEQNSDLMADPEIELHFPTWVPTAITQILGGRRSKFVERGSQTFVDTRFHDEVTSFLSTWAENIKGQGWVERAKVTDGNP